MGKFSRDKGARVERNIVHQLTGAGIIAERVPLSGSMGGSFTKDISVEVIGKRRAFEVKARAEGFKEIYKWLKGAAGLFLKADRQSTLVVLRFDDWAELVNKAQEADMLKREICLGAARYGLPASLSAANDNLIERETG